MAGNKESDPCEDSGKSSLAAGSVGEFFQSKSWEVISFFPNSPCVKLKRKSGKKAPDENKTE